jgi:hypothetical protein
LFEDGEEIKGDNGKEDQSDNIDEALFEVKESSNEQGNAQPAVGRP